MALPCIRSPSAEFLAETLSYAAYGGNVAVVERWLNEGADPQLAGAQGDPVIVWAVRSTSPDGITNELDASKATIVRLLSEAAPVLDVNAVSVTDGLHPLWLAVSRSATRTVAALIDVGADVDAPIQGGLTVLTAAAGIGDTALVRVLLSAGADPCHADDRGRRPLDVVLEGGSASAEMRALLSAC